MACTRSLTATLLFGLLLAAAPRPASAQSNPLYIQFSPAAVKGALYKPD